VNSPSRPARLAGKGYPADPQALAALLDGYFNAPEGPGAVPPGPLAERLSGLILPHIDFARGGPCYAWGYREAEAVPMVDRWVILGTAHTSIDRPFAVTRKNFETPLGVVESDRGFIDRLLARVGPEYLEDEFAHRGEHSIELQTVFLRHRVPPGRPLCIVPVLCGSFQRFVEEARSPVAAPDVGRFLSGLRETLAEAGGRSVVLASADLAHVGPQFGDASPVTPGRLQEIAAADREALAAAEEGDPQGFFAAIARDGDRRRICGLPPIYAALSVLGGARGRLLRYAQWPDPRAAVTFASVGLYAGTGPAGLADGPCS
jgi:AmmeMemoRadiSam system protein B